MLGGVAYKVASTFVFACMLAIVKVYSALPVGELVFFRSFFALFVLVGWLYARGDFPRAIYTKWLSGHLVRSVAGTGSMFTMFAAYALLPLADVTAIGYAGPLMIVLLAGLLLKERIGPGRWAAVMLGFVGVLVMLREHLAGAALSSQSALGAIFALVSAFCVAIAMVQTRRLVQTEHMGAVIFYFQATTAIAGAALTLLGSLWPAHWPGAATLHTQGWIAPGALGWAALIGMGFLGGLGQILMTRSYMLADASIIACFEYSSMIWVLLLGVVIFDEWPSATMLAGAVIVIFAGILVVVVERPPRLRQAVRDPLSGRAS